MNITVYCGSSFGSKESYRVAAVRLGQWIGQNHHTLVYGGGQHGLMGTIAKTVMESSSPTIGVIPSVINDFEQELAGLTECYHVETIFERKNKMIELGDVFIAMPGGVGTLEEITEILSLLRVKLINCPCIFYNVDGFYDLFEQFIQQMVQEGFLDPQLQRQILFSDSLDEIENFILNFDH